MLRSNMMQILQPNIMPADTRKREDECQEGAVYVRAVRQIWTKPTHVSVKENTRIGSEWLYSTKNWQKIDTSVIYVWIMGRTKTSWKKWLISYLLTRCPLFDFCAAAKFGQRSLRTLLKNKPDEHSEEADTSTSVKPIEESHTWPVCTKCTYSLKSNL